MLSKSFKKSKKLISGIATFSMVLGMVAGISPAKSVKADVKTVNTKRNVMYYGDWSIWGGQGMFYPKDIPADQLTHLNFAFIYFDTNGNLVFTDKDAAIGAPVDMDGVQWGGSNAGILNAFQELKAENPNLKIGVSVGGWSKSHNFAPVCANASTRAKLVENLVKFMDYNNMDFIDIDWEYPCAVRNPDKCDNEKDEGTKLSTPADKENFVLLLKDLREALDKKGLDDQREYELSVAIPAPKAKVDEGIDVKGVFKYVDFANIMTYDMRGAWDETSGHHTGLYANPYDTTKGQGLSVDESVQYYLSQGAPADKIVIGAAYYSRGWEKVSAGPDPNNPGLFGNAEVCAKDANLDDSRGASNEAILRNGEGGRRGGVWSYRSFAALKAAYPGLKEYWDDTAKAPYMYDETSGAFFTYDNVRSIQEKAKYVNENNLGGMIAWMASQDAPTTSTKRDELTKATKVGLFGNEALPTYETTARKVKVSCTVTPYSEAGIAGGGYEIVIKNDEQLQESGEVLQLVEKSGETIKTPKFYIKTDKALTAGDYTSGTVTREGDYIVVDISKVYEGKTIEPGKTYTLKLKSSEVPTDTSAIKSIELSQSIYAGGAELGKQVIFGSTSGGGTIDPDKNEAPVIKGADAKSIVVGSNFDVKEGVTATDKEDGDLTNKIVISGTVDTSKVGTYKITYSVTDSKGETAKVERTITVVDKVSVEYEPWSRDYAQTNSYPKGSIVSHKGKIYEQVGSVASWYGEPGVSSEWKEIGVDPNYQEVIEEWSVSIQNAQGYPVGAKVTHNGKVYVQSGSGTVWYGEPGTDAGSAYWKEI